MCVCVHVYDAVIWMCSWARSLKSCYRGSKTISYCRSKSQCSLCLMQRCLLPQLLLFGIMHAHKRLNQLNFLTDELCIKGLQRAPRCTVGEEFSRALIHPKQLSWRLSPNRMSKMARRQPSQPLIGRNVEHNAWQRCRLNLKVRHVRRQPPPFLLTRVINL